MSAQESPASLQAAKNEFFRTGQADPLLARRTEQVDAIVAAAHRDLLGGVNLALLAVGGYGRRQLFPHSDVDLMLLFENEQAAAGSKKELSPFLQKLWDSGLRLSHSV